MAAAAKASVDVPPPPGFEGYAGEKQGAPDDKDGVDESELEEFRLFMKGVGSGSAEEKPAATPGPQDPWHANDPWGGSSASGSKYGASNGKSWDHGLSNEAEATVETYHPEERGEGQPSADEDSWNASTGDQANKLLDKDASFETLGLSEPLLRGVYEMGFVKPSKIQAAALPHIGHRLSSRRGGKNMIGQAQNGSGKTATFSLALLTAIDVDNMSPQALVLNPTRELAKQNEVVIAQLGQFLPVKTQLIVPGMERVARSPRCHVLVGTPGKLLDLVKKRVLDVTGVKVFVLDEADIMLDQENQMGPQVLQVRDFLPEDRQVLFFSATYPEEVRHFAEKLAPRAVSIKVKKTELTVASVQQMYVRCKGDTDKFDKLCGLYASMTVGQSIVFVNARRRAFSLAKELRDAGFAVSLICGTQSVGEERMDPTLRDQVMEEFRQGVTRVLIATDVLSRGIDAPQVTLVVNYQLPVAWGTDRSVVMETYLHRVGRTGRFGLQGIAVNLVADTERAQIDEICKYFDCKIPEMDGDYETLEARIKGLR